jgi:hypothetical protein
MYCWLHGEDVSGGRKAEGNRLRASDFAKASSGTVGRAKLETAENTNVGTHRLRTV